tara:strand:- start:1287 stop:2129 length:843 start_codon:yes stop_codon:yes gene_type:complete
MNLQVSTFETTLFKYKENIANLLQNKYGISSSEFIVKAVNAIRKNKELLKCNQASLFGSIMYFAEIGLPFNTPEGFGYILPYKNRGGVEATPIIGYKGLIEIAYRNPNLKSFRIQAVYENDEFDYAYGTDEYIKHKPSHTNKGKLVAVYAIAHLKDTNPMFVVVHEDQLNEIQKLSKSGNSNYSPYNNGTDVFNIMQSKVAAKLLFKTLPKSNNEVLTKVLDMDNKFDYEKNVSISVNTEGGYDVIEQKSNTKQIEDKKMPEINPDQSEAHLEMTNTKDV